MFCCETFVHSRSNTHRLLLMWSSYRLISILGNIYIHEQYYIAKCWDIRKRIMQPFFLMVSSLPSRSNQIILVGSVALGWSGIAVLHIHVKVDSTGELNFGIDSLSHRHRGSLAVCACVLCTAVQSHGEVKGTTGWTHVLDNAEGKRKKSMNIYLSLMLFLV